MKRQNTVMPARHLRPTPADGLLEQDLHEESKHRTHEVIAEKTKTCGNILFRESDLFFVLEIHLEQDTESIKFHGICRKSTEQCHGRKSTVLRKNTGHVLALSLVINSTRLFCQKK